MILKIRKYGDLILRKKSHSVIKIDDKIKELIENMFQTLYSVNGIGLAAPQIGELLRIVVIDISSKKKEFSALVLINPEILHKEEEIFFEESCLSIPGITKEIKRAKKIIISAYNENLEKITIEAEELFSIVLQHEIDHLNGILFIDKLPLIEKKILQAKLKKIRKSFL
ncbi:MAG: peptide deformylase [bacterium]